MGKKATEQAVDVQNTSAHPTCCRAPLEVVHGPFDAMSSAEFAGGTHAREWTIQDILMAGRAAAIVGVRGSLKSCLAVDAAISVATGTKFLGEFPVPNALRVAFFDGGGAQADLRSIAKAVCDAREASLESCDAIWVPQMPDLSNDAGRRELRAFLRSNEVEMVVFDTLEQSALDVAYSKESANVLRAVSDVCVAAGSTPVFVQHVHAIDERPENPQRCVPPPNAAAFPFVRQWIVVSRDNQLRSHKCHPHRHTLMVDVHGASGIQCLHRVEVTEEMAGEGLAGRRWTVPLHALPGSIPNAKKRRADEDDWDADDDDIDEADDE